MEDLTNMIDRENIRKELANHYLRLTDYSIDDPKLIDEAISTIEHFFEIMPESEILGHSRHLAIPYLALLVAKDIINKE